MKTKGACGNRAEVNSPAQRARACYILGVVFDVGVCFLVKKRAREAVPRASGKKIRKSVSVAGAGTGAGAEQLSG